MKKTALVLTVIFALTVSFLFCWTPIQPVKSQSFGTIYIRSDGSVEGTDLIERNNNTYTFLGDVSGSLVISKNGITLDGSGFTLKGNGVYPQNGIGLSYRKDVTVKNLIIMNYSTGIALRPSNDTMTNITILNNYILNCDVGIDLLGSSNNLIKFNTFKNNSIAIAINYVLGDNIITQNNIDSYIQVWMSDQPTIDMNYWADYNGTDSDGDGIGDTAYFYHDILEDSHPLMEQIPVIPEFPARVILPLFMVATILMLVYFRNRKPKHPD
jgi:parallel beta-helix repeat protein